MRASIHQNSPRPVPFAPCPLDRRHDLGLIAAAADPEQSASDQLDAARTELQHEVEHRPLLPSPRRPEPRPGAPDPPRVLGLLHRLRPFLRCPSQGARLLDGSPRRGKLGLQCLRIVLRCFGGGLGCGKPGLDLHRELVGTLFRPVRPCALALYRMLGRRQLGDQPASLCLLGVDLLTQRICASTLRVPRLFRLVPALLGTIGARTSRFCGL